MQFRILDFNFVKQKNTELTASSEALNFPVENIRTDILAQSWRSSGFFKITSLNNKLSFKETSDGPTITVYISEGEYNPASLGVEIKTKMQLASLNARTYSCSFSKTTGLWRIAGQLYLELFFNEENSIGQALGFAAANYSGKIEYDGAKIAIHTEEYIQIDLKTTEPIDSFVILFDKTEAIKFSNDATIKLQANATPEWSSPAVNETLTFDVTKKIISHYFAQEKNYRFWRVLIRDCSNLNLFVELGHIILGKATQINRCPDAGFEFSQTDQSEIFQTQYGNIYCDLYPKRNTLSFNYSVLDYENVKKLNDIYLKVGTASSLFFALDPFEQVFSKNHFYIFGRFEKNFSITHLVKNYFKTSLKILETL